MRTLISGLIVWLAVVSCILTGCSESSDSTSRESEAVVHGDSATGTLAPAGPPTAPPTRVGAGQGCIVDLRQSYMISGSLSGTLDINFRIKVDGPCGSPMGTFDEEWIAHGVFSGTADGKAGTASFTYCAQVKAGGDVNGEIVFGQGLEGKLQVTGNFADGELGYQGRVTR